MFGAFRGTRILLDARNRFSKVVPYTQTRKRNDRKRIKILKENSRVIREGRDALAVVNARSAAEAAAASPQTTGAKEM